MHPPTSPDEVSTSCSLQTHRHTQAEVRHWTCVFPPSPCTHRYGKNWLRLITNIYIRQIPKAVSPIWDQTLLAVSDHHMSALCPSTGLCTLSSLAPTQVQYLSNRGWYLGDRRCAWSMKNVLHFCGWRPWEIKTRGWVQSPPHAI